MKFKPTQQKIKKIHAWVPKLAFGIAGMFLLALTPTACQREDLDKRTFRVPQVQSEIAVFPALREILAIIFRFEAISLVISGSESSDVSSSALTYPNRRPYLLHLPCRKVLLVASKPPASSALSSGSSVPEVSSKPPSSNARRRV